MQMGNENISITLFEGKPVRRAIQDDRWFYSVIDVVAVLVPDSNPRKYWFDMKRTIKTEGFAQLSEKIRQLKLKAPDGAMRETDCADVETLLRIIQSIPSPNAEPFKQWLAGLGADAVDDRTEDQRRIDYREEGIEAKKRLHEEVHGRGVRTPKAHQDMEVRGHTKLYGGETPQDTKERKGIGDDDIGEWMGSDEIIDNSFRDAQSRTYIQRMGITGKAPVIKAHEDVSSAVRRFITEELGNPPPEELPTPKKSLTQVRKDEKRRSTRGMDLFPEQDDTPQVPPADDPTE